MPAPARVIEAAGGVLWRPALGGDGVEVALVHRPKYDDWSVPKGKLGRNEHPLIGAVREVWEETGHIGVPGRRLGQVRYLKDGEPKRVRYWVMASAGGSFMPTDEVDQLMWLPPREAQRFLYPDRDRGIIAEFARDPEPTWPLVLVRHGSAGDRAAWAGDDRERPLDAGGHAQAQALVPLLDVLNVRRVLSADVLRCLETVGPYAEIHHLPVESEPLVSESGFAAHPETAVERLLTVVAEHEPVVVCSQGKAMPDLIAQLCARLGYDAPADTATRKGAFWILHVAGDGKLRIVCAERFDPAV
jgi:8-oxo-dGTP diphosphatase